MTDRKRTVAAEHTKKYQLSFFHRLLDPLTGPHPAFLVDVAGRQIPLPVSEDKDVGDPAGRRLNTRTRLDDPVLTTKIVHGRSTFLFLPL